MYISHNWAMYTRDPRNLQKMGKGPPFFQRDTRSFARLVRQIPARLMRQTPCPFDASDICLFNAPEPRRA